MLHVPNLGIFVRPAAVAGTELRDRLPGKWINEATTGPAAGDEISSNCLELAADGIRVCAVNPVIGETGLTAEFMGEDTPERREQFRATIPLGRFSTPADIAAAALFLASDEASLVTGVCLEVDGGRCV